MSELTAFDLPLGPPPDAGHRSGQVLADRYELSHVIGRGGTAVVWVARDSVLDIDVAAKIVLPSGAERSAGLTERTIQEARLCAQLTDPAVCRVLDFGFTREGEPFVISELLSGETLDDCLLRDARLAPAEAVRLLLPILDALGAAHKKGIVHRDVKPANVFLAYTEGRLQPKLLDFGIACSPDVRNATAGTIWGTPCYMSPEQARGSTDLDEKSDLWSFCVMLYETVTGTAPFQHDNCNATLFAITSQTPPALASLGYDAVLSRIVERGMQKERAARWPSAAELANVLARWLVAQGFESDVSGISLRRRFLERSAPAVPALLDAVEELSSERAVTFAPPPRTRWAGPVAVSSALVAAIVVVAVALSARQSAPFGSGEPVPAAVAPVLRPPPEPPLPVPEGSAEAPVSSAAPEEGATSTAGESPESLALVPSSPKRATPRRRAASAEEPALFPTASPFSPSPPAPPSVEIPRAAAPQLEPPEKPRVRGRSAPRRDYGI